MTDHSTLTEQQLNEIEARKNAATPGSWAIYEYGNDGSMTDITDEVRRLRATKPVALPARWECSHGPADDEPFCAEAEDDSHACPTIRVHPDDAEAFAALIKEAQRRQTELRRECDLAVAHDRQPYPTAWAYEQACKARTKHQERADAAEAVIAAVRAKHKPRTERHGSGCVQCGIVWPCPTYRALDVTPAPAAVETGE